MKIGLDARFYNSAGGLGRYSQQLTNYLAKTDMTNHHVVFLSDANIHEFETNNANFKKIKANARWYTLKEQFVMPWKIWRARVDLMHFFHWNVPLLYRGRFIVTIHDLILLKYPSQKATTLSPLFFAIKYWAYKKVLRHAIYRSMKIIVPSEFVKKDILANFHVPTEKVVVIYEGAGMTEECHCDPALAGEAIPFEKNHEIASLPSVARNDVPKKPYLLYVGVAYPHKNLEGLIRAFKIFREKYSKDYHLVLVGQENYFYRRLRRHYEEERERRRSNPDDDGIATPRRNVGTRDDNIIFTGFVPDAQIPAIYQNASLYVFPSFCEGFGLPALEAMNYGLPVLAANNSCLPEILGKAALYFDPYHHQEMADKMWQLLSDDKLREKMKQLGFEQAKKYSWEKTAQQTLQIYQNVV